MVANVVTPGFIPATGVSDFVVTLCWSGCLGLQPGVTHMTLSLAYLTTSPPPSMPYMLHALVTHTRQGGCKGTRLHPRNRRVCLSGM